MNLFVAKLNPTTTTKDLQKLFAHYGLVTTCKVINDRFTGRSKGYGFVEMPNNHEANEALKELDNSFFKENIIIVKQSQPTGFLISADESGNRNSTNQSSGNGNHWQYNSHATSMIKPQRYNNSRSNFRSY